MNVFLVVYELADLPGDAMDPEEFFEALRRHPASVQLTSSAWLVRTRQSSANLFESLDRYLAPPDRLFVAALTGEAVWRNIEQGYAWLEEVFGSGSPSPSRFARQRA